MNKTENYEEWKKLAIRQDMVDGADIWKVKERSDLYDYRAIRKRVDTYRELRANGDDEGLLFALNEGIHGNMGGMGKGVLYKKAHFGTKQLIVDYVEEVSSALEYLASPEVDSISLENKLEFFHRASHCYGRSALMLSGSGSLFYFHLGVVKALWEEDILPSVISGSSGGAIVAAIVGCHSGGDLKKIFDPDLLKMEVEREKNLTKKGFLNRFSQVSSKEVENFFERLIPDITFQEAAELTGIHINVSVAPAEKHQTSRLLNDIASPNVMIREALLASAALPGFYPAVTLAAKDQNGQRKPYLPSRKWIDGSVSDDLPIKRVMRLYGVNHTIVSQTNPLALPFVTDSSSTSEWGLIKQTLKNTSKEWALAAAKLIDRPMNLNKTSSRLLTLCSSVLAQTYTGDINILPPKRIHNPVYMLMQPSSEEILQMIKHGERATWPQIEKIRLQTKISRTLDNIVHDLEMALVHEVPRLPTRESKVSKASSSPKARSARVSVVRAG
ncbi:MAG: DUF3336 domain-containing protein [Pseudomonadales bacterium]|nr:DUF3336 domain-containing protein [Pseudomonadales bacterium]